MDIPFKPNEVGSAKTLYYSGDLLGTDPRLLMLYGSKALR